MEIAQILPAFAGAHSQVDSDLQRPVSASYSCAPRKAMSGRNEKRLHLCRQTAAASDVWNFDGVNQFAGAS